MNHDASVYREILDEVDDGVYFVDRDRRITYWSRGAERISGFASSEVLGRRCMDNILRHVDGTGRCLCHDGCPLTACLSDGQRHQSQVYLHHRDGHRVPVMVRVRPLLDKAGAIMGAVETFTDASAHMADLDRIRALEDVVFLDPLTGVANRWYFQQSLEDRLAEQRRQGWPFGLLMVDIDHFKRFNDQHGHLMGDRVLVSMARTLVAACRPFDLVARWGGEEFAVIALAADAVGIVRLAARLKALVAQVSSGDRQRPQSVTVSIGAAMAQPGDTSESLLSRVDAMLYQAKNGGRDRICTADAMALPLCQRIPA